MNRPRVPNCNPKVVFRELADGEAVLLHLDTGAYHGVNEIGAAIWHLVDGTRDEEGVTEALRAKLDDHPDNLLDVVSGYLDELAKRELVVFWDA